MNRLHVFAMVAAAASLLVACGDDDSSGDDEMPLAERCDSTGKLTKSCLEGKWVLDSVVAAQIFAANARPATDVQYGYDSYTLTLSVDNATRSEPITREQCSLTAVDDGRQVVENCEWELSTDSTSITFHPKMRAFWETAVTSKATVDTTWLKFPRIETVAAPLSGQLDVDDWMMRQ